ncbi:MAG TPA: serine hydrolase domain-containing protein [Methylomirabilota bacterium]|nr:serine hydrolase domain-containing protein [Methylomirabilota bacterium]
MSTGGLSKARLGRMHDVMAGHVERGGVPGLVTLVSRRGEVHVDAIGLKAVGGRDPIGRDTIFRISSMTKPITAAATMILVEECKLRLDEPVDRLLPELADRKVMKRFDGPLDDTVPAHRPITVRDLLTFRMGFGIVMAPTDATPIQKAMSEQLLGQGPPSPATTPAPDEWIRRLGTLPLMHQPGEKWMYHTGSDVLGVLIARASGQALETFLRERLFEPLGMKDTGFSVPATKLDRLATSYWTNPETGALGLYDEAEGGQWSRPPAFPSGGAGLVSTIDDYLAFGQMMLGKGKHGSERILSRPSVETMTTDQLTPEQKAVSALVAGYFDSHGWGFGVSMVTRRDAVAAVPGQFGWDGGLGTSWRSDPKEEMVGILMTQHAWTSPSPPDVCLDFWTSAYQAIDD